MIVPPLGLPLKVNVPPVATVNIPNVFVASAPHIQFLPLATVKFVLFLNVTLPKDPYLSRPAPLPACTEPAKEEQSASRRILPPPLPQ